MWDVLDMARGGSPSISVSGRGPLKRDVDRCGGEEQREIQQRVVEREGGATPLARAEPQRKNEENAAERQCADEICHTEGTCRVRHDREGDKRHGEATMRRTVARSPRTTGSIGTFAAA